MVSRLTLGDADIAKVLLTIAEHQERLADPSYSKKLREDILTLPEELQKKIETATALVAKGDALKAEIKKQQDAANEQLAQREAAVKVREATMEQINTRKAEAEATEARAKTVKEENKKKEDQLALATAGHIAKDESHKKIADELFKRKSDLEIFESKLNTREKEIQAYETEINETAAQVSGLIKQKMRK